MKKLIKSIGRRLGLIRRSEAEIIASIRRQLHYAGYDTSQFTDEEIKQGVISHKQLMRETGLTIEQASNALRSLPRMQLPTHTTQDMVKNLNQAAKKGLR